MKSTENKPEVFKIIDYLKTIEWATKEGLFKYSIGIFIILILITFLLQSIKIEIDSGLFFHILTLFEIIHFLIWLVKRIFFYKSDIKTIAFAIKTEEKSKEYYNEIIKRFMELVKERNLYSFVKIKKLPSDVVFNDLKEAESFISRKRIGVLVWGKTFEGNENNSPLTTFKIKISYQYLSKNKEEKKFISDISNATKRKYWKVWQPQSDFNLTVVSKNIFEISLFTLGKCLLTVPNVNHLTEAVKIFENLKEILKDRKTDDDFPNLKIVKEKTNATLLDAYLVFSKWYWYKKDFPESIKYAEKAIKFDENNFIAHQNLAICKWLDGDEKGARYHTKRAWKIKPGNPTTRLNRAFFHIYDKKFEQGIKEYKKVKYVGETNIIDVIEFIENESEKNKNNLGLLFISGWLDIEYVDKKRGVKKLKDFLLKSKGNKEYFILTKEAEKVLNKK